MGYIFDRASMMLKAVYELLHVAPTCDESVLHAAFGRLQEEGAVTDEVQKAYDFAVQWARDNQYMTRLPHLLERWRAAGEAARQANKSGYTSKGK